jgi:7-cyano-7-deazaguanine reductase
MTKPDLKNLGSQTEHVLSGADASLLETVPNPMANREPENGRYWWNRVTIIGDEFTSLCPATRGPDFGEIKIEYIPNKTLVESKSLKYYLESYRMEPIFHEAIVAKIRDDLVALLDPHELRVKGNFKARGGWAICPTAEYFNAPQGFGTGQLRFTSENDA